MPHYLYEQSKMHVYSVVSDSVRSHGLLLSRLFRPWDFPGKNVGLGCHFLLQGIFPTSRSSLVSYVSCVGRQILHGCSTWETQSKIFGANRFLATVTKVCILFSFLGVANKKKTGMHFIWRWGIFYHLGRITFCHP